MLLANNKVRTTKIAKALLTTGLLGGAACFTLSSGSASAACSASGTGGVEDWGVVFSTTSSYSCQVGDKKFDSFSTNIQDAGSDVVEFGITGSYWDLNANFDPARNLGVNDYYEYKITITNPNTYFDQAFVSWITNPPTTSGVKKEIFDATSNALLGSITANNASFNFAGNYSAIRVRDTVTTANSYDAISNNFSQKVPGPLPLFGAGAAFGFSRRIRSRIKKTRFA